MKIKNYLGDEVQAVLGYVKLISTRNHFDFRRGLERFVLVHLTKRY